MPHRIPKYERLWHDLEAVLMPTLAPFASENGLTLPFVGPYPRFFLEKNGPGDDLWIDLALHRESSDGYTEYSPELPFRLSAGRLKQLRDGGTVTAYELVYCRYERRVLAQMLATLQDDLSECYRTARGWTADDLRLGKAIRVPPYLAKV